MRYRDITFAHKFEPSTITAKIAQQLSARIMQTIDPAEWDDAAAKALQNFVKGLQSELASQLAKHRASPGI